MKEESSIISKVNKTKLTYAISIIDKLVMSKDLNKINNDLQNVWRICGFQSRENSKSCSCFIRAIP